MFADMLSGTNTGGKQIGRARRVPIEIRSVASVCKSFRVNARSRRLSSDIRATSGLTVCGDVQPKKKAGAKKCQF